MNRIHLDLSPQRRFLLLLVLYAAELAAALPGLEAFLMLERLRLLAGQASLEDRFVVIDAPATGHALELLAVARSLDRLAPTGTRSRLKG